MRHEVPWRHRPARDRRVDWERPQDNVAAMIQYVQSTLLRDLRALRRELEAYPAEADLWKVPDPLRNSAGTLALHLLGNLRHYIGARLGDTGYVRDRPAEFSRRNVPRAAMIQEIEQTIAEVSTTLERLDERRLVDVYPDAVAGVRFTTGDLLVHLVAHTGYHLGQIDYHRRLVTGAGEPVGAMAITELGSAKRHMSEG